jgi:cytosine/adenosine deaminase-related metal-dependent hydrolase
MSNSARTACNGAVTHFSLRRHAGGEHELQSPSAFGVAPLSAMLAARCRIALGIDGSALEDDDDALRELRLVHFLHVGNGFNVTMSREDLLRAALLNGRAAVTDTSDGGSIRAGEPADILLLDWSAIDDDRLRSDIDALQLVLTRATARHIRELIVGGRTIVEDGVVVGVDARTARTEVLGQMRQAMPDKTAIMSALPVLERAIAKHFEPTCF